MLTFEKGKRLASYLRSSISKSGREAVGDAITSVIESGISSLFTKSFQGKDQTTKNLLFEQKQILKAAEAYIQIMPWITYFAATKHILLMKSMEIDDLSFSDFKDKEYYLEIESCAESLARSTSNLTDAETIKYLNELIELQQTTSHMQQAIIGLEQIASHAAEDRDAYINSSGGIFEFRKMSEENARIAINSNRLFFAKCANLMNQNEMTWIRNPKETIIYLKAMIERRSLLEDTYFSFLEKQS